jgi:putative tryptophan/tyrosine transport system substrate-binding protein
MRRRDFITLLGGAAAAWPMAVRAQQEGRVRRVGMLMAAPDSDLEWRSWVAALRDGLRKLGWVEGRNLRMEVRWAADDAERMQAYAAELVGMMPDAIFAAGIAPLAVLQRATRTIPLVFAGATDPTVAGLVTSRARPGGNITGFTTYEPAIAVKWLELLKQIAPHVTRVGFIYDPKNPAWSVYLRAIEAGAPSFGITVWKAAVRDAAEIEPTLDEFARGPDVGLIMLPSPVINVHRKSIIAFAAQRRVPAVYPFRLFVTDGGLTSYGVSIIDQYRSAAVYLDRILKGEKPEDLPVQLPTRFELVINTKTAEALGLDLPLALLIRADELIE